MVPNGSRERDGDGYSEPSLDPDAVLDALATDRRRSVVRVLRTTTDTISIEELARHVVAQERQTSPQTLPSDRANRVATRLYHVDLPKLREAMLVDYNDRNREVRLAVDQSELDELLADELGMSLA